MAVTSRWTEHGGVRLHYVENAWDAAGGLPVVFSPGVSDWAEEYAGVLEFFAPRRAICLDLRGRGRSEAPVAGYRFEDLTGDVEAVVEHAGLGRLHLMTFSRGTTPALGFALRHPGRVVTLSIGDYLAEQIALPESWPSTHLAGRWRGRLNSERTPAHVPVQLQREGVAMSLWEELGRLPAGLLVAGGGRADSILQRQQDRAARYRAVRPEAEIVIFEESGHDLFRPDRLQYPRAVAAFMGRHEPGER